MVARITPDWKPADPKLPRSFIAKISSSATSKQVLEDKDMVKAAELSAAERKEILQYLDIVRIRVIRKSFFLSILSFFILLVLSVLLPYNAHVLSVPYAGT